MKIDKDEKHNLEFKQSWRDEYLKWICAFANTHGGSLYIGVKDDGEICGVKDYHKLSEDVPNKILQSMGLICEVKLLNNDGKKYFRIDVEKYPFPVSYHGKYYKRSGSTTQEVVGNELDKMILAVQGRTWDSVPVPHVDVTDLDNDSIKIFKKMALDHNRLDSEALEVPRDVLLRNLRLFENDYLTRAAVMCFHPDPEKWVTCAYIKIGFFADNDADIIYQDEVHGSLIMQVEKTMDLIYTKYMKALISYDGIHRKETFFFPKEAFRELLLNAVIHRDYMKPTPLQIRVYAHKIRIWNIGKMPVDVPVEKLFMPHSSEPRNPNIANVFFKAGYVESWGRGYKNISDICKFRKAKLPIPEENSGGLVVECPPSKQYLDAEKKQGKIIPDDDSLTPLNDSIAGGQIGGRNGGQIALSERQLEVLQIIKDNPMVTRKALAGKLGINESAVQKHLETLKQNEIIKHIGKTRGYWQVLIRQENLSNVNSSK